MLDWTGLESLCSICSPPPHPPFGMQDQAELKERGYDAEMIEDAASASLDEVSITMKKLPPLNWVDGQVGRGAQCVPGGGGGADEAKDADVPTG